MTAAAAVRDMACTHTIPLEAQLQQRLLGCTGHHTLQPRSPPRSPPISQVTSQNWAPIAQTLNAYAMLPSILPTCQLLVLQALKHLKASH